MRKRTEFLHSARVRGVSTELGVLEWSHIRREAWQRLTCTSCSNAFDEEASGLKEEVDDDDEELCYKVE